MAIIKKHFACLTFVSVTLHQLAWQKIFDKKSLNKYICMSQYLYDKNTYKYI